MKKRYTVCAALMLVLVLAVCSRTFGGGMKTDGEGPALSVVREYQFAAFAGVDAVPAQIILPLVMETQQLAEKADAPGIQNVFVDNWPSDRDEFNRGHIPGSAFMSVDKLMDALGDGSAPPDKTRYESMMQSLGIRNGDHVLLYGAGGNSVFTLGAFWIMDYFRHGSTVYLNGGLAKWKKEKRGTAKTIRQQAAADYRAGIPDESLRADAAYVLDHLNDPEVVIVDVRSPDEYSGERNAENNRRTGHIPGAINLNYYDTNFNAGDGTLKSRQELQDIYDTHGVTRDKEIILYCQGGIRTANTYFVLSHVLGYPRVRNYVGSWGEWGNRLDFDKYPAWR